MKTFTIFDIAKLSGVGKSTVSRVLNNDPKVSKKTRNKVNSVIKKYDYSPSSHAQRMAAGKSKTIGIISSRLDSASENRAIRGMLEVIYQNHYDALLLESSFSPSNIQKHIEHLARRQVEGAIIFCLANNDYSYLKSLPFPVVMVGQTVQGHSSVVYNDRGAILKVMEFAYKKGCRKIAYIGVKQQDPTTGLARFQAYSDFCHEANLTKSYWLGGMSFQEGYDHARKAVLINPDCIVCASDTLAIGVRRYLTEQGRNDILVTGIGNNELMRFLSPNHVSVRLSYKQSGFKAVELLQSLMADKLPNGTTDYKNITMPCELIAL